MEGTNMIQGKYLTWIVLGLTLICPLIIWSCGGDEKDQRVQAVLPQVKDPTRAEGVDLNSSQADKAGKVDQPDQAEQPLQPGEKAVKVEVGPFILPAGRETTLKMFHVLKEDIVATKFVPKLGPASHHAFLFAGNHADIRSNLLFASGAESTRFEFPEGTGISIKAGTILNFEVHYVNATGEDINNAYSVINIVGKAEAEAKDYKEIGMQGITIFPITWDVLPGQNIKKSQDFTSLFDMEVVGILPHLHEGGTLLSLYLDGQEIYRTGIDLKTAVYPLGKLNISKGQKIRIETTYENPTDETLKGVMGMAGIFYIKP
jgi:hypothetical protein